MMPEKQTKTDLGKIKIHAHAISCIASIAAMEVDGVLRIDAGTAGKIWEFVGAKPGTNAVGVRLKENNELDIIIPIVVIYGHDIPRIANNVQENVRQAIEKMTGLIAVNIDVKVRAIEKMQGRRS